MKEVVFMIQQWTSCFVLLLYTWPILMSAGSEGVWSMAHVSRPSAKNVKIIKLPTYNSETTGSFWTCVNIVIFLNPWNKMTTTKMTPKKQTVQFTRNPPRCPIPQSSSQGFHNSTSLVNWLEAKLSNRNRNPDSVKMCVFFLWNSGMLWRR